MMISLRKWSMLSYIKEILIKRKKLNYQICKKNNKNKMRLIRFQLSKRLKMMKKKILSNNLNLKKSKC